MGGRTPIKREVEELAADLDASNGFSNAFQSSSSTLTHDDLLGSTVFAGETLNIR
jgi:hypothetical protein